jgi:hypothetical protein
MKSRKPAEQALVAIMNCLLKGINQKGIPIDSQFGVEWAGLIPI